MSEERSRPGQWRHPKPTQIRPSQRPTDRRVPTPDVEEPPFAVLPTVVAPAVQTPRETR
jgi:hypothetical protein